MTNIEKLRDLLARDADIEAFVKVFRIMAEGTYDRREFEDSRYDEAELFSARYGFQQKGFEQACRLQDEMLKRKKTSIPDIGGQIGAFSYRMLALDDIAGAFFGQMLDCCQMIGGAGASCMYHSCTSENGRVFLITDKSNRPVAGSWVWRNGSTICFDNIEGVRPSAEKAITLVYKEAAEKLAQAAADGDGIRKVTFGGGYSDISSAGFETDDANIFPIEKVSYIADSRKQYILYLDETVPAKKGPENTPAVYENADNAHMKFELGVPQLGRETVRDTDFDPEYPEYRTQNFRYDYSEDCLYQEWEVGTFAEAMEKYLGHMDEIIEEEKARLKEEQRKRRRKKWRL